MLGNNRHSKRAFWGTVIGTSIGMVLGSKITPMNKRKIKRTAKKASSSLRDMMD